MEVYYCTGADWTGECTHERLGRFNNATLCSKHISLQALEGPDFDDDFRVGINSIGTDYGAECSFYNRYVMISSSRVRYALTMQCSPDCGMESRGVQLFSISYPGCSTLPDADPPVSSWEGTFTCLILGTSEDELCVLRVGSP
jgi:hypothetical protein